MPNKRMWTARSVVVVLAIAGASLPALADTGAVLLDAARQAQLETWLGEGPLALSAVYSKQAGDTAADFHAAADGKGRTFSLMEASNAAGQTWLIGGYNPQSWSSDGQFNITESTEARTAFLFNLTLGTVYRQTPNTYGLGSVGSYQTYNAANYGPTFGIGHDLFVPANLSSGGYSLLYSYVDPNVNQFGISVLDGGAYTGPSVSYGALQVFTVSAVPEPATYGLLLGGLMLLAMDKRRRSKACKTA